MAALKDLQARAETIVITIIKRNVADGLSDDAAEVVCGEVVARMLATMCVALDWTPEEFETVAKGLVAHARDIIIKAHIRSEEISKASHIQHGGRLQ